VNEFETRKQAYFAYLVAWTTNDGWEDCTRCVIASEPSLAHARSIVNDQSSNIVVTHFRLLFMISDSGTVEVTPGLVLAATHVVDQYYNIINGMQIITHAVC